MTDRQLTTSVLTVAVCALGEFQKLHPDHSLKAREIGRLQTDVAALGPKMGTRIVLEGDVELGTRAWQAAMNVFKEASRAR